MPGPSAELMATFALEAACQAVRFQPWIAGPLVDDLGDSVAAIVLRAQLALERDDRRAAGYEVARLPAAETTRHKVEVDMMRALTAHDTESMIVHIESALSAAAPERYVRTIIGAGRAVPALLAALPAGTAHRSYTDILSTASKSVIPPARTGGADPLIEPLSERELVVLRYLSTRLTNPEIAAALYISRNTLKTHGKAVFRKLAVSSRAEAVEVGRSKRLI